MESHFEDNPNPILHVHDIGSRTWFQTQNKSIAFYTETDFNVYLSDELEAIQSHSFDFTYALLRNKHLAGKARELGLHTAKCIVCCIWNYLFKHSTSFTRNSATVMKKRLGLTPNRDLIFVDLSFPLQNLPKRLLEEHAEKVLGCVQRVMRALQNPVCVLASNNYFLLEEVPKRYPQIQTNNGLFFTRERYQVELQHQLNTTTHKLHLLPNGVMIPKTEHNALMYFFMGYHLQLNSTVLFTSKNSLYSQSMAAFREFYSPGGTHVVNPDGDCKLERFRR